MTRKKVGPHPEAYTAPLVKDGESTPEELAAARRAVLLRFEAGQHDAAETRMFLEQLGLVGYEPGLRPRTRSSRERGRYGPGSGS